jgi:hypothetical protein
MTLENQYGTLRDIFDDYSLEKLVKLVPEVTLEKEETGDKLSGHTFVYGHMYCVIKSDRRSQFDDYTVTIVDADCVAQHSFSVGSQHTHSIETQMENFHGKAILDAD